MAEGGRLNATTWFDRTNYFETVPKGALELALWMEADRHGHLLDARDPGEPRQPARRGQGGEAPALRQRALRQRADRDLRRRVPQGHPYHHPTIGSMDDLDAASLEDVHAFYRRFYGPNNTVLTLVGDLTPQEGFAAAERYFGPLPASAEPPRLPVEPLGPLSEPVRDERVEDVPADRLHLAFRLPVDDTAEFFAASLAMDVLGGLATSRLSSGWSAASRSPTACRPTPWASSTGCRWASSASTWPRAPAPTRSRRTPARSCCGSPRRARPRSRWSRPSPRPSGRGCPRWPARRSGPTPSATARRCRTTRAGSTRSWTGSPR